MRWDQLFSDLEGQAQALEEAESEAEIADQVRVELGRIDLLSRLRAAEGHRLALVVDGAGQLHGDVGQVGADWLLLKTPQEVIVPLAAVVVVSDLPGAAVSPSGVSRVSSRLRLTVALRAVALDRCAVTVTLRAGTTVSGTPDRVGADFMDLALHDVGDSPRRTAVRGRCTVPFGSIGLVRRTGGWA
jgi:hypothetical protein